MYIELTVYNIRIFPLFILIAILLSNVICKETKKGTQSSSDLKNVFGIITTDITEGFSDQSNPKHIFRHKKRRGIIDMESTIVNDEPLTSQIHDKSPSNCIRCQVRQEAKQLRIEEVKSHILKSLGLESLPNITGLHGRKLPPLESLLNVQNDSPGNHDYYKAEDEEAKTTRVILLSQKNTSVHPKLRGYNVQFFQISKNSSMVKVAYARLWLHTKLISSAGDLKANFCLYDVAQMSQNESPTIILKRTSIKYLQPNEANWVTIDVKDMVSKWFDDPSKMDFSLVIQLKDMNGTELKDDVVKIVTDPMESDESLIPFIEVDLETHEKKRSKRTIDLQCTEESKEENCCRYPLIIDFNEFGWDWIIVPRQYRANYCAGDCSLAYPKKDAHSHLLNQVKHRTKAQSCCYPKKSSPISMLYFQSPKTIALSILPDMIVERCGCP